MTLHGKNGNIFKVYSYLSEVEVVFIIFKVVSICPTGTFKYPVQFWESLTAICILKWVSIFFIEKKNEHS